MAKQIDYDVHVLKDTSIATMTNASRGTKMIIHRAIDSRFTTTGLRRFASCRKGPDVWIKGKPTFPNGTAVELLGWAKDEEGFKFGKIRVLQTDKVGYMKARHLHTEEEAQAMTPKSSKRSPSKAHMYRKLSPKKKAAEPETKILEWDEVRPFVFELIAGDTEVVYFAFKTKLIKKIGRESFEKHKPKIQEELKKLLKLSQQKRQQRSPVSTSKSPSADASTEGVVVAEDLPSADTDQFTPISSKLDRKASRPIHKTYSISTRAQHELESILKTPAGLQILHKEAAASGHNIDACRAKLIRAVRRAAMLKEQLKNLAASPVKAPKQRAEPTTDATRPSPNFIKASRNSVDFLPTNKSGAVTAIPRNRRRSLSVDSIPRIPSLQLKRTASTSSEKGGSVSSSDPDARSPFMSPSTRLLDKAIRRFNVDIKMGMQELVRDDVVGNDAIKIGDFLRTTKGINKEHVGEVLGNPQDFYLEILDAYVAGCEFKGLEYKNALRSFLNSFRLPKEAQKIERILATFAKHYSQANPNSALKNQDTVFVVAYAILMLNTSIYNPKVKASDKITKEQFVKMLLGCDNGGDLPTATVEGIYDDIKMQGLFAKTDREDVSGNLFTTPKLAGPMSKRTDRQILYQKRWMLLTPEDQLFYFKEQESVNPLGFIDLKSARLKVKKGCMYLLPVKGERQVKSVKMRKDKPSELGKHDVICLKVPKEKTEFPGLEEWVKCIAEICGRTERDPKSPQSTPVAMSSAGAASTAADM